MHKLYYRHKLKHKHHHQVFLNNKPLKHLSQQEAQSFKLQTMKLKTMLLLLLLPQMLYSKKINHGLK